MRKTICAAALLGLLAACSSNEKAGYIISGTVQGAAEGDSVFLEAINNNSLEITPIDTAIVRNGQFTFEGRQDTTVPRYITCITAADVYSFSFFLENGRIQMDIRKGSQTVTGTPTNDTYQHEIRTRVTNLLAEMNSLYDQIEGEENQEKIQAVMGKIDSVEMVHDRVFKDGMRNNMNNPIGIFLFKQRYIENSLSENEKLYALIPAEYLNDIELVAIRRLMDSQKKTDVSTHFTDLTLQTPEGKEAKLSDYVGKGRYVLVDFWASWCGPCRMAMPELVELYGRYKGRLEIVGISLDDDSEAWKGAIAQLGISWPQLSDLQGWKSDAITQYGITSIPHMFLIDPEGTIIARGLHTDELADRLADISK